jgi:hypothetical protein
VQKLIADAVEPLRADIAALKAEVARLTGAP